MISVERLGSSDAWVETAAIKTTRIVEIKRNKEIPLMRLRVFGDILNLKEVYWRIPIIA
jgi:hypothetical protein